MSLDFKKIGQQAANVEDMTKDNKTAKPLPRAGVALLRFRDYIEYGREAGKGNNKPALKVSIVFELHHPDHLIKYQDKDGNDKTRVDTIKVQLPKGSTSASNFRKLFATMNTASGGGNTHMIQMLGNGFLAEVTHNTVGEGAEAKTYANLSSNSGAWSLKAPTQIDALSNTSTPIVINELTESPKVFLWDNAELDDQTIVDMWESIYIEGMYESYDDKPAESRNIHQERIRKNLEWEGSREQGILDADCDIVLEDHEIEEGAGEVLDY